MGDVRKIYALVCAMTKHHFHFCSKIIQNRFGFCWIDDKTSKWFQSRAPQSVRAKTRHRFNFRRRAKNLRPSLCNDKSSLSFLSNIVSKLNLHRLAVCYLDVKTSKWSLSRAPEYSDFHIHEALLRNYSYVISVLYSHYALVSWQCTNQELIFDNKFK